MPTLPIPNIKKEIAALRRLINRTRRDINNGAIDPLKGGRLITQTSAALSRLLLTQHHLESNPIIRIDRSKIQTDLSQLFPNLYPDPTKPPQQESP